MTQADNQDSTEEGREALLSIPQVAEHLSVTRAAVDMMRHRGKLPPPDLEECPMCGARRPMWRPGSLT